MSKICDPRSVLSTLKAVEKIGHLSMWFGSSRIERCTSIERAWVRIPFKPEFFFLDCFLNCISWKHTVRITNFTHVYQQFLYMIFVYSYSWTMYLVACLPWLPTTSVKSSIINEFEKRINLLSFCKHAHEKYTRNTYGSEYKSEFARQIFYTFFSYKNHFIRTLRLRLSRISRTC